MSKPYMPLMMGDWLRGTRGMKAEVRGVYINLLIHQYDHGYLPSDMETLSLIDPEVGKVWVFLKEKFLEVAPGKLQNKKLEEVRGFWEKQGSNGKKGGRPKKENPKPNPDNNPKENPNTNHHIDLDLDNELDLKKEKELKKFSEEWFEESFDPILMESFKCTFPQHNVDNEFRIFKLKIRGDPEYKSRDLGGIRNAFIYQLQNSKATNGNGTNNGRGAAKGSARRADAILEEGKDFGTL